MADKLFTIIVDYDEGTYVSQHTAVGVSEALYSWAESEFEKFSCSVEHLYRELECSGYVALKGLNNVWCDSISIGDSLMIINVVETSFA